ncbi:MAG: lysophospholipase [archaeon]|nr:lysophospholipase [archaeon]
MAQASHSVPWANGARTPPDAELFPQYLQNKQGLWLYWHHWPVKRPRGVIFLVSGLGEHTVRYQMLSARFNKAGFVTFSLDHQGHGASEGDRAHVERFQDYVDDYLQFVKAMLSANPSLNGLPRFLLGHSMGGLIAVHARNQSAESGLQWAGTILSAPALKADPKVATPLKIFLAGVLSNLLPKLALDPLNSATVSRSRQVVELYCTDPLVYHGGIRARWGNEVLRAMQAVARDYQKVTWPFLLLHGGDDCITHISGSLDFFEHVPSTDKVLKTYQGMFHEVFNEPNRDIVIHDVLDFIEARVK